MLTEVLSCGPCFKASKNKEPGHTLGRFRSWDSNILCQLSPAHQAMFSATLTVQRGVDNKVLQLLRDMTEGNTMAKVWRKVQESHCEDHLRRKDMYTTLLCGLTKPGGIVSSFKSIDPKFKPPPKRRELPSPKLLRHAFMLSEADQIEDFRCQILSTFGNILKMDSTKRVAKKLSGAGRNTAEWFTSIANEHCQIVSFVLTCEESTAQWKKMADEVIRRYKQGSQPVPLLMYVDCGCCRAHVPNAVENMFVSWVDGGMVIRLDIWHWMHRFAAAVRTESHPKYELLMSALSAAVLAYNNDDLDLVIKATRAKSPDQFTVMSDKDLLRLHISKETLKHYVRRVTIGAQETYRLMEIAIQELKGPAGLDENGISLFKYLEAIDGVWANQQKHIECIQDPPGMSLYRVVKTSVINGVSLPYYKCERGSSSLEGFHKFLPYMIPGPHCAARPFQVYLISGIARWNADRAAESVYGKKGRNNRIYSSPLIQRLNSRCKDLFGDQEVEEPNYRAPAISSDELIGLEYLFDQSTSSENPSLSVDELQQDGPSAEEEVTLDMDADEGFEDDHDDMVQPSPPVNPEHIVITTNTESEPLNQYKNIKRNPGAKHQNSPHLQVLLTSLFKVLNTSNKWLIVSLNLLQKFLIEILYILCSGAHCWYIVLVVVCILYLISID